MPARISPVPKQVRSELSTRALLDAAADLIAEVGYERASLAAIGERAGYSHGLVTRRFGSKENMLWTLVERMTLKWGEQEFQPAFGDRVGAEAIAAIIDAIRDSIRRSPRELRALYSLMFDALKPIPVLHEQMVSMHRGFRRTVEGHIHEGINTGSIPRTVDPAGIARLVQSCLRGAAYQWILDPDDFPIDQALADLKVTMETLLQPTT
jgi:AcrR family transcriptional regulator